MSTISSSSEHHVKIQSEPIQILSDMSISSFEAGSSGYDASCESLAWSPSRRNALGPRTVSDISASNSLVSLHHLSSLKKSNSMSKIESITSKNPETYWASNLTPRSESRLKLSIEKGSKLRKFGSDHETYIRLLTDSYGLELIPYSERIVRIRVAEAIFAEMQKELVGANSPRNWLLQISPRNRRFVVNSVVKELIESTTLFYPFIERLKNVHVSICSLDLSSSSQNIKELQNTVLAMKEINNLSQLINSFNALNKHKDNKRFVVQLLHEDPETARKLYKKLKEWNKSPENLVESVVGELFKGLQKTELFTEGTLIWHRNRTRPLYTPYDKIPWEDCFNRMFYVDNNKQHDHVEILNQIFHVNGIGVGFAVNESIDSHELASEWLKKLAITLIEKGFYSTSFGGTFTVELLTEYIGMIFTTLHPQRLTTPLLFLLKNDALKNLYLAYLEHQKFKEKVNPPPSHFFEILRKWMTHPKDLRKSIVDSNTLENRFNAFASDINEDAKEIAKESEEKAENRLGSGLLKTSRNNNIWKKLLGQGTLKGNFFLGPDHLQKVLSNQDLLAAEKKQVNRLYDMLQKLNTFTDHEYKFLAEFTAAFFDLILMSSKSGRFIGEGYYFVVNMEMLRDWNFKSKKSMGAEKVNIKIKNNGFSVKHWLNFESKTVPYALQSIWNLYYSQNIKDEAAWTGSLTIKPAILLEHDKASRFISWRLDSGLLEPIIPKGQKKLKIRG